MDWYSFWDEESNFKYFFLLFDPKRITNPPRVVSFSEKASSWATLEYMYKNCANKRNHWMDNAQIFSLWWKGTINGRCLMNTDKLGGGECQEINSNRCGNTKWRNCMALAIDYTPRRLQRQVISACLLSTEAKLSIINPFHTEPTECFQIVSMDMYRRTPVEWRLCNFTPGHSGRESLFGPYVGKSAREPPTYQIIEGSRSSILVITFELKDLWMRENIPRETCHAKNLSLTKVVK